MRQSLAVLALRERCAEVFKMGLDKGFTYEEYFENAANLVKQEKSLKRYQVIAETSTAAT
jgi:hypothetical protein